MRRGQLDASARVVGDPRPVRGGRKRVPSGAAVCQSTRLGLLAEEHIGQGSRRMQSSMLCTLRRCTMHQT